MPTFYGTLHDASVFLRSCGAPAMVGDAARTLIAKTTISAVRAVIRARSDGVDIALPKSDLGETLLPLASGCLETQSPHLTASVLGLATPSSAQYRTVSDLGRYPRS
jgi:hypothetical protein